MSRNKVCKIRMLDNGLALFEAKINGCLWNNAMLPDKGKAYMSGRFPQYNWIFKTVNHKEGEVCQKNR